MNLVQVFDASPTLEKINLCHSGIRGHYIRGMEGSLVNMNQWEWDVDGAKDCLSP